MIVLLNFFPLVKPDKLIPNPSSRPLQPFLQTALRLGQSIGGIIKDSHLILTGKVPFDQATDFFLMTGNT